MTKSPQNRSANDGPSGRRAILREALAQHQPWLRTVVLARLGEAHAVDEVMQQTAAAAAKSIDRLQDPQRIAPWLYRLAVTQALQYRRKMGRQRKLMDRYRQHAPPTERDLKQPDPLDWLLAEEQRAIVHRALQTLPSRDAEVLLLKHTQDWSYQKLSEHMGISQHAVEGRLQRARKKLRRALTVADPTLASL